ncbi:MAG: ParA family protein [Elusimicrobia bacterium]|nr:ParA family protein [Elusimicrobiota bacterium]
MVETIVVANQKGGVGKTTTAINLSAALANLGFSTLLIDMDPQGNATSGLGFDKSQFSPNIYNVVVELMPLEKTIKDTAVPNLRVSGANPDLLGAELALASALGRESRLRGAISSVKGTYKFILIDCPPSLGILTINALNAADKVIIPIQGEYYALEGLAQFVEAVTRVKETLNPKLSLEGGLLTMFDSRMLLSNQVKDEVSKFFGPSLFSTIIPRNIRLAEAPGFGQSIMQYDAKSRGASAYLALANEFLARRGVQTAPAAQQSQPEPQPTESEL